MGDYKKIHFVGIGGIGMSGLARLCLYEKKEVSGTDSTRSENTEKLAAEGVQVSYEQKAESIPEDVDLVVFTEAMPKNHPELVAARERGIKTLNYFEALGMVANEYYLIAVSGTHGKTTTTAMLIDILEEASFDPTAIVGSLRTKTGSNFRAGKSKYFVVEACEYRRDFLTLNPDVLVITNIEHEHVDYYKNLSSVQDAFHELAMSVPEEGAIIAQTGDANVIPVLDGVHAKVINYNTYVNPLLQLVQPGIHNQLNAAAARAVAEFFNIEEKHILEALENFAGTKRRFEYKGEVNGAPVYDDYAHHPTEIKAAIAGVKERHTDKKVTVVFQPHTFSRTNELFDAFAQALSKADRVLLAPIYAAREENESGVSSKKLADEVKNAGGDAEFFETFEEITSHIKDSTTDGDVIMVMGAGDIISVSKRLIDSR